jgi:hypothetical protein
MEVTLHNIDTIKNTITSKFKEKLWCNEEIEDKRKFRYYKEERRTNSKEFHSETSCWKNPKMWWDEKKIVIFVILRRWRMKGVFY